MSRRGGPMSSPRYPRNAARSGSRKAKKCTGAAGLTDFEFPVPPELIAQHPAVRRTGSRLLHLDGRMGALEDLAFPVIARLLSSGEVLVLNDTRVIKARLKGRKDTG